MNSGSKIVWGNDRVFVSPVLGCPAKCSFCYLLDHGKGNEREENLLSPEMLLLRIVEDSRFTNGETGTIISLGCMSECLTSNSIDATIKFLNLAKDLSNPVQIATRWILNGLTLKNFLDAIDCLNIVIFQSMTEGRIRTIEIGTPPWQLRKIFMQSCVCRCIPTVLYIKPFIPTFTKFFIDDFTDLAKEIGVKNVVVGPLYLNRNILSRINKITPTQELASCFSQSSFPVGPREDTSNNELTDEVITFIEELKGFGLKVFTRSTDALRSIIQCK